MKRARPSSPRPARSSCRWYQLTAGRSATARPGWWPMPCAAISIVMRKQAEGGGRARLIRLQVGLALTLPVPSNGRAKVHPGEFFGRQDIQERLADGAKP